MVIEFRVPFEGGLQGEGGDCGVAVELNVLPRETVAMTRTCEEWMECTGVEWGMGNEKKATGARER
jgi:hypothetical protein